MPATVVLSSFAPLFSVLTFPPNVSSSPPKCAEHILIVLLALLQQTSADGMLIYSKKCNERRSAQA